MLALFTPSHCSGVGFRTRFTSMIQAARFNGRAIPLRSAPFPMRLYRPVCAFVVVNRRRWDAPR